MPGPVYCECGAMLVQDVGEHGVTLLSGEYVIFERKTDYVACAECLRSYHARDLLPGGVLHGKPPPEPEGG